MMPTEVVALAKYMRAHFPQQPMDEYTSEALSELLEPYPLADCRRAVLNIAERGEPWCAPSAVRLEVKRIRARRVDEAPPPTPPPGLDPDNTREFNAWLGEHRRAVADGAPVVEPAYLATRHIGEIRELLPRMPKVEPKPREKSADYAERMAEVKAELAARGAAPIPGDELTAADVGAAGEEAS